MLTSPPALWDCSKRGKTVEGRQSVRRRNIPVMKRRPPVLNLTSLGHLFHPPCFNRWPIICACRYCLTKGRQCQSISTRLFEVPIPPDHRRLMQDASLVHTDMPCENRALTCACSIAQTLHRRASHSIDPSPSPCVSRRGPQTPATSREGSIETCRKRAPVGGAVGQDRRSLARRILAVLRARGSRGLVPPSNWPSLPGANRAAAFH